MTLADRLKQLRLNLGLTQAQFADAVGIATSTYQHYERGDREATEKFLVKTINTFGLNASWLLTGKDEMLQNDYRKDNEMLSIPLSSITACCGPGAMTYPTEFLPETVVASKKQVGKIIPELYPYAVQTTGRSMVGYGIEEGSIVIINPAEDVYTGSLVLVVIDEKASIKKLYERNDGIDLAASNGTMIHITHEDLKPDAHYVRIMGKVMLVISHPNEEV